VSREVEVGWKQKGSADRRVQKEEDSKCFRCMFLFFFSVMGVTLEAVLRRIFSPTHHHLGWCRPVPKVAFSASSLESWVASRRPR